jgi:hypothetical protein
MLNCKRGEIFPHGCPYADQSLNYAIILAITLALAVQKLQHLPRVMIRLRHLFIFVFLPKRSST